MSKSAFLSSLGSLDLFQIFTPRKVGSLPYVPRLDHLKEAVEQAGVSVTSVEVHRPPQASTPAPTPALRTSVPAASRRHHQLCVQGRPTGGESESEEDCRFLPVMSLGSMTPPQRGARSKLSVRPVGHRSRLQSLGDVLLTDVISRMKALEVEGFVAPKTTKGAGKNGRESASSGDSWSVRHTSSRHRRLSFSVLGDQGSW